MRLNVTKAFRFKTDVSSHLKSDGRHTHCNVCERLVSIPVSCVGAHRDTPSPLRTKRSSLPPGPQRLEASHGPSTRLLLGGRKKHHEQLGQRRQSNKIMFVSVCLIRLMSPPTVVTLAVLLTKHRAL